MLRYGCIGDKMPSGGLSVLGLPSTLGWRIIAISRKFTASSHRFARPLLKDSILMDESLHLLVSLSN